MPGAGGDGDTNTLNIRLEYALVITDYDGGLPPVDQQPVPCGEQGTVPEGEVPCYTPDPTVRPTPKPSPRATPKR